MMQRFLLGVAGAFLVVPTAHAATIVRCGNSYSDTPSVGCRQIATQTITRPRSGALGESQYAVDGVRTGMTLDQAMKAIAAHFGIPVSDVLQRQISVGSLGPTEVLSYIASDKKGPAIGVKLGRDPSTSSFRVETVVVGQPSTVSSRRAMQSDALTQYGPPTGQDVAARSYFWCDSAASDARVACPSNAPQLMLFNSAYRATLKGLTGGGFDMMAWDTLALNTTQFANARAQANQRQMKEQLRRADQGRAPLSAAHPLVLPTLPPYASRSELRAYQHKLLWVSLDSAEQNLQSDLRAFPNAQTTGYGAQAIKRDRQRIATLKRELNIP